MSAARTLPLADICEQDRAIASNGDASKRYLGLEHIESESGRIVDTAPENGEPRGTSFKFDARHVLYGKLRPYLNKVALPSFVGRCSTELIPLLPREGVDRNYLGWLLRSPSILAAAVKTTTGSRMPRTDMADFLKTPVSLPPLAEQKRIAAKLSAAMEEVDKARRAVNEQLALAARLPFNVIAQSLNGETRRVLLSDAMEHMTQGAGKDWAKYELLGATRNGVAPAKAAAGKNPGRYKPVDDDTVFYNPMRILIGSIAMLPHRSPPAITSPDYVVVRGRKGILASRWFYHWLRSPLGEAFIRSNAKGAVRERLTWKFLSSRTIQVPSWESQHRYLPALERHEELVGRISAQLEAVNALPARILADAFGT